MYWSRGTQSFLHRCSLTPMYLCLEKSLMLAENGYFGPKLAYIVTLLQFMLDTWVWCLDHGFWVWKIIWDHLPEPQIDLKVKNRVDGLGFCVKLNAFAYGESFWTLVFRSLRSMCRSRTSWRGCRRSRRTLLDCWYPGFGLSVLFIATRDSQRLLL